jgi:hypothetical protein
MYDKSGIWEVCRAQWRQNKTVQITDPITSLLMMANERRTISNAPSIALSGIQSSTLFLEIMILLNNFFN